MHLEVLVEEPSMEQGLRLLLPKLVGEASFRVFGADSNARRPGIPI